MAPPHPSKLKLNVDVSWNSSLHLGGVGWAIRDSTGSLIATGFKRIVKNWSILMLEACALKEGLSNYLKDCPNSILGLDVESDSESLIKSITNPCEDLSKIRLHIEDVIELTKISKNTSFVWCPRFANSVAHTLAREASMMSSAQPQVGVESFCNSS